ncbi:MAG: PHP domain-containing protein [Christensenellales bacterium]|jgi:predicted metal-dependent phosphoesterase TrpH
MIDLHMHTNASDGTDMPAQLVRIVKEAGGDIMAITDHDTTAGLSEAANAALSEGITFIPGVEFSVSYEREMHILGYAIDPSSPGLESVLEYVNDARLERNPQIIKKLRASGMDISMELVEELAKGSVIGRPHIAEALVKLGYVSSINEAFDRYLAKGRSAYVSKEKVSVENCLSVIKEAGGVSVLAHPKTLGLGLYELDRLVNELKEKGLGGIEVYYSSHTYDERRQFYSIALKRRLLITGGSDYHGLIKPDIKVGDGTSGPCPGLRESAEYLSTFSSTFSLGKEKVEEKETS